MNYNALTLRYFETPLAAGVLTGAGTFRGAAGNRAAGTWVQFDLAVRAGRIEAARFLAFACPHTIAVAAWMAEQAPGRALGAVLVDGVDAVSRRFEVPVEKRGRLLVIEDAWTAAVAAVRAATPAGSR